MELFESKGFKLTRTKIEYIKGKFSNRRLKSRK